MANGAENQYFLDGVDLYTGYSFIVTSGSDGLLQFPERKKPLSHDWAEENGTEYDLISAPKYRDRQITLKGFIVCENEVDFWTKYDALFVAFDKTGTRTLTVTELARQCYVFYLAMKETKRHTRIKNTSLIGVEISIDLQIVTHQVNTDDPYTHAQYQSL